MLESLTDEILALRAIQGCAQSFTALYHRHRQKVYRFACQMSGSTSVAEDVTQEVFLSFLAQLGRFDGSKGALLPYLMGIARNQTYRSLRKEQPFLPLDEQEESVGQAATSGSVLHELTERETLDSLRNAIAVLPHQYREVLILCDLEEMDYAQAAQALGCAIGTVRSRLHRARALLMGKWQNAQQDVRSVRCSV